MNRMIKRAAEKAQRVSKKVAVATGVAVFGGAQAFAGTGLLTTVDTSSATADVTLVIVALVGFALLIMGGRKVLSLLGH
ncbi:hypothetical protein [Sulfuricurvum sp.]|uniref:hypothetical protein n=1 Tax=Sulfuricurvum sp. TaxID=2025608 RepID=UPI003561544B